jgi:hypothetical protein
MLFFSDNSQQRSHYVSTQQPSQSYGNQYDTSTLRSSGNIIRDEQFGNEILARAGPSNQYQHPDYRTHESMKKRLWLFLSKLIFLLYIVIAPNGRMDNLNIQSDNEPLRVVKPADQNIHYKQQVNVRFLQPPPGPEPAPIIIKVNISLIENFNLYLSEFRNVKHPHHLHYHQWLFDNVHQHHQHLLLLLFVSILK